MSKRRREEEEESSAGDESEEELLQEMLAVGSVKPSFTAAEHVNNKDGLRQALNGFRQSDLPWIERLEVVSAEPASIKNVHDDLQVELAFYGQALAAVTAARGEFDRQGVPHKRPNDYFAEMLKSDDHMRRVKDKLVVEKQRITAVEHRKKEREAHAFNKQAQSEKVKAKAAEKRGTENALAAWRKKAKDGLDDAADLEAVLQGSAGTGADRAQESREKRTAMFKRAGKEKKYGHGGKKRGMKQNDRESSKGKEAFKSYSVKRMKGSLPPGLRNKGKGGGGGGSGGRKNAGANRPGKRARVSR